MQNRLIILLLLTPSLALAQTQVPAPVTYPFAIKGRIGKLNAPAKMYLMTGLVATDSVTLQQGRFELRGTTPFPQSATLVLERQGRLQSGWRNIMLGGKICRAYVESRDRLRIFLEPGPVVVTSPDSLRAARVVGGALTADYQRLKGLIKPVDAKSIAVKTKEEFSAVNQEYIQTRLVFVKANPTSWVSLEVLQQVRLPQYGEVAPLYAALTPAQRASPPGQRYGELLAGLKNSTIGTQAPDFTQKTPEGKSVSLVDYRGKYVLIDFWASWCGPCRQENPSILKVYEAFKGRNFEVLGVSIDDDKRRNAWVKAIADDHMPWTQVSELGIGGFSNKTAQLYGVQAIPRNFLVDPSGKIVASNLRGEELATTLAKFIK